MKKHLVVLASVLAGFVALMADAQPQAPTRPSFDGAMSKLFGDNTSFSATMDFQFTQTTGNQITMPGKVAHSADKSRFDMDMANMRGGNMPPQAALQMKRMGMSKMASITRGDKGLSYILYPDMRAYIVVANQDSGAAPSDYKSEVTKLGKENIDGHDCVKNKVVVAGPDGVPHESTVWNASDLKQFPLKIETKSEKGTDLVMLFKDVKLEKPAAAQFEVPANYTKFNDMMSLMMSRARAVPGQ